MAGSILFEEEQRPSRGLTIFVCGLLAVTLLAALVAMSSNGLPTAALLAAAPAFVVIVLLFATLKMCTRVDADGVEVKTMYLVNRRIEFPEIASAEGVQYRPLFDYGGWGYRLSHKGKAYNMRGDRGVFIKLKSGGRVMIGSQRDAELAGVINDGIRSL